MREGRKKLAEAKQPQTAAEKAPAAPTDPVSHEAFVLRLDSVIASKFGGSARALAKEAGVSGNAIHLWRKTTEPGRDKLVALARAAGVSVEWLATGSPEDYIIPFYDLDRSGGFVYPLVAGDNAGAFLSLRKDLIPSSAGPYLLVAVHLTDEEERDGAGQTLVVDRSKAFRFTEDHAELPADGTYLIAQGGRLFMRYLNRAGNDVEIMNHHDTSRREVVSRGAKDFWVVGEVVGIWRQPHAWSSVRPSRSH